MFGFEFELDLKIGDDVTVIKNIDLRNKQVTILGHGKLTGKEVPMIHNPKGLSTRLCMENQVQVPYIILEDGTKVYSSEYLCWNEIDFKRLSEKNKVNII